jgi:serine/threonine protein phosphatase PrpC
MARWVELATTNDGTRKSNEDFVDRVKWYGKRRRVTLLVACDGIGSRPDASACARGVGRAALEHAVRFLKRRNSTRALGPSDATKLAKRLRNLKVTGVKEGSGTTFVLSLFDHKRHRAGYSLVTLWAGDSRAYLLDSSGGLHQLTSDHQSDERRITRFYDGLGRVRGGDVDASFYEVSSAPRAICLTTDGVHERCSPNELREFMLYCITRKPRTEPQLSHYLTGFLARNIGDNYSMSLMYKTP